MKLQHPENRSRFFMNGSIDEEDGSDDPVLLDPAVWGALSSDILAMILGWLPLPALCRFRSVSKAWHAAIGRIRKVRHGPWYVSCAEGAVKIANPRDWELFGRHWRSLPQMPGLGICRLCAAAGGLFYFVVAGGDFPYKDDAVVLNPLTGYWKELPRVPRIVELRMERMSVWRGMEALGQDGDFLVVNLVECVPRYVRRRDIVQVYDSRQRRWSTNAELVLEPGEFCAPGSAALHGSILYFLTFPGNPDATARLRPFRLDRSAKEELLKSGSS
ncbi:hypothetical protein SELMODRAFT_412518 [Selaginella moellendorffii]|uniref:F-box domain-containing protein n=1 Tax=Selaginella moellendorffii TaxID=88036 RepID=D8RLR0_SELML|nr:hypothetical protein SELMODRAFT_412518 [Selaginella moellendorffii]